MSAGRLAFTKARTSSANRRSSGVNARSMRPSPGELWVGRSVAASPVGASAQQPDRGLRRRDPEWAYGGGDGREPQYYPPKTRRFVWILLTEYLAPYQLGFPLDF